MAKTSGIWRIVQLIGGFIIGYWLSNTTYGIIILALIPFLLIGRTILKRKQLTYVKESLRLIIASISGYLIGIIYPITEATRTPIILFIWFSVLIFAIIGTVIGLRKEGK